MNSLFSHSHCRHNPLLDNWILVSPHRAQRPWQGLDEQPSKQSLPEYDADCYLCPGNTRAGGAVNPLYQDVHCFDNDYSAFSGDENLCTEDTCHEDSHLLLAHSEHGICRVLCFSPKHNLTIARMEIAALEKVVERWAQEYQQLGDLEDIRHVQIFENHGIQMGCSNPHPHCQIWAKETIPQDALTRSINQLQYVEHHNSNLLLDYLNEEMAREERILSHNNHFVWLVPFWAVWPFETMVIPIAHHPHINSLSADERLSLASMLKKIGIVYDNLFQCDFPYSLGIHQSPTGTNTAYSAWQMHLSYYPPLLRSATVRKHMVGYELCAMPQRDISPEQAADRLREISDTVHFMDR